MVGDTATIQPLHKGYTLQFTLGVVFGGSGNHHRHVLVLLVSTHSGHLVGFLEDDFLEPKPNLQLFGDRLQTHVKIGNVRYVPCTPDLGHGQLETRKKHIFHVFALSDLWVSAAAC